MQYSTAIETDHGPNLLLSSATLFREQYEANKVDGSHCEETL